MIFKYTYGSSLAIVVSVSGNVVKSFPFTDVRDLTNESTICGANNYFYKYAIFFLFNMFKKKIGQDK